jgi:hypothetical protein
MTTMPNWSSDLDAFMQSDWKIIEDDGTVLVKVIGFPAPDGEVAGESMWVQVVSGTDNDGTGTLRNGPVFSDLCFGDLIRYGNGTDTVKPEYLETVVV